MTSDLANELAEQLRAGDPALGAELAGLIQQAEDGIATEAQLRNWVADHMGAVKQLLFDALPPVPGLQSAIPSDFPANGWQPRVSFLGATIGVDCLAATVTVQGSTVALGLLPPAGVTLELDAGPAVAGGMVTRRPPDGAAGALGVRVGPVEVNGFAILEGLSGTVSVVVVLGIHFLPPVQLSFGFALSAVGGVVGVNRAIDGDALRARLADGSALDALFPDDPVAGAPRLIDALAAIFPRVPGQLVVGPTFTLTWLDIGAISIVRVDLGILIQLPDAKVALVGRAKVDLGPILALRLDVLGEVDPGRKLIAFDAVLVDSRALVVFRVTGSAAFRLCSGDPPYQVATLGGFYPGFDPKPASIPPQQRLGIALDFPCPLSLRANGYLAITSNTFQVGADIEVGIDLEVISAHGFLRFDAIVHFDPFHIHADYAAGFEVEVLIFSGGTTVSGWIDGPGPWTVHARVSISLLIDDFSWSDTFTFGPSGPPPDPPVEHLVDVLAPTLDAPSHIRAADAIDPHVVVRPKRGGLEDGTALCSPLATLSWQQSAVPLALPVVRAGGRSLASEQTLTISIEGPVVQQVGPAEDWFAPGMFLDLTESVALQLPPFQRLIAGTNLALGVEASSTSTAPAEYRTFIRRDHTSWEPDAPGFILSVALPALALAMAAARAAGPVVGNRTPIVSISQETWAVTTPAGTIPQASAAHALLAARPAGVAHALADQPVTVGAI